MEAAAYKRLYPHEYYDAFVREGARPDGRPLGRARPVSLARGVVTTADGSALVKIGRTTALAAVKLEVVVPALDTPDCGSVEVTVELPPMCSSTTKPGRPSEESAYCSRRLADVLRDADVVDVKKLCIRPGMRCWKVFVDVYVLDHDGCVLDAAILAANGALRDCVVPAVSVDERGEVCFSDRSEALDDSQLDEKRLAAGGTAESRKTCEVTWRSTPLSLTTALYRDALIVDPNHEEEQLADSVVTVCLDASGKIILVSKPGGVRDASEAKTAACVAGARARYATLREKLTETFDAR
jgi:exosome complex component RRP43